MKESSDLSCLQDNHQLMQLLSMLILSKTFKKLIPLAIEKSWDMWDYWINNELQISNIQFHLSIQPRQSENRKAIKSTKPLFKKWLILAVRLFLLQLLAKF